LIGTAESPVRLKAIVLSDKVHSDVHSIIMDTVRLHEFQQLIRRAAELLDPPLAVSIVLHGLLDSVNSLFGAEDVHFYTSTIVLSFDGKYCGILCEVLQHKNVIISAFDKSAFHNYLLSITNAAFLVGDGDDLRVQ